MESVHGSGEHAGWDELQRHRTFVRRLARGLVRDAARAEDLEQEAWKQALEHPPRDAQAARSWFAIVLRRLSGRAAREEERRTRRERLAARPESVPAALEIEERLQLEQTLVRAVENLREPYRSTVFLRYFEDLSPRAIAARAGEPVATVKTRLRRALELLREALERGPAGRDRGDRAWALALVRLAGSSGPGWQTGALVGVGILLAGAALLVARGATRTEPSPSPPTIPSSEPRATTTPELEAPLAEPPQPARVSLASHPNEAVPNPALVTPDRLPKEAARVASSEEPLVLRGRVLYADRSPVGDANVALGTSKTRADAHGTFELPLDPDRLDPDQRLILESRLDGAALVAWHEGWVPAIREGMGERVLAAWSRDGAELEPVELVLPSPALEIAGRLLERDGRPANGWRISLLDGRTVYQGLYRPFTAEEMASGASTHLEVEGGRFVFGGLDPARSYRVRAWNSKTLEQVVSDPLPAGTMDALLRAPDGPWRPLVDGVVVALDGSPIAGVRCRLSMDEYRNAGGTWMTTAKETRTGPDGRFEFRDVPPCPAFLRFDGDCLGGRRDLDPDDPGRDLRVELEGTGVLRFESEGGIDTVYVLDEDEERLRIAVDLGPGRSSSSEELRLESGRCEGRVSERARWLVLEQDGLERARLPLLIRHAAVTDLRW